jgi:hypothetical protein
MATMGLLLSVPLLPNLSRLPLQYMFHPLPTPISLPSPCPYPSSFPPATLLCSFHIPRPRSIYTSKVFLTRDSYVCASGQRVAHETQPLLTYLLRDQKLWQKQHLYSLPQMNVWQNTYAALMIAGGGGGPASSQRGSAESAGSVLVALRSPKYDIATSASGVMSVRPAQDLCVCQITERTRWTLSNSCYSFFIIHTGAFLCFQRRVE